MWSTIVTGMAESVGDVTHVSIPEIILKYMREKQTIITEY